jgi:hypothetical protein
MNWQGMLLLLDVEENKASMKLIVLQRESNYNVMVSQFVNCSSNFDDWFAPRIYFTIPDYASQQNRSS